MEKTGLDPSLRKRNVIALVIGIAGLFHMAGRLSGIPALAGVGAASTFSPAPKVFSDVDGLETFASAFTLRYTDARGIRVSRLITPALYSNLSGPYNRRNVYGAALSYAPRLPEALWTTVFCHGMRPGGALRRELGVPDDATAVSVEIATKTKGRSDRWVLEPAC